MCFAFTISNGCAWGGRFIVAALSHDARAPLGRAPFTFLPESSSVARLLAFPSLRPFHSTAFIADVLARPFARGRALISVEGSIARTLG